MRTLKTRARQDRVWFISRDEPPKESKEKQRAEISAQTAEFLASGNKITHCETRIGKPESKLTREEVRKRKARRDFNKGQSIKEGCGYKMPTGGIA